MNLRIAHIVQDEKFPDSAHELFESVAPGVSDYILISDSLELKYLKLIRPIFVGLKESQGRHFLSGLKNYDFVIVHGLSPIAQKVVWNADKSVTFVWVGMGYDYYDLIYPDANELLKTQTQKIKNLLVGEPKGALYKKFKKHIKIVLRLQPRTKNDLINKIAYFAPVVSNEFGLVKAACPQSEMRFLDWNYGLTAKLIQSNEIPKELTGNNILLGNSATLTNNHFEVLSFLEQKKSSFRGRKVIMPLNYGDQTYKAYIREIGQKLLGGAFLPIEKFMSFEDYMLLLSSCSTVIMNHKRQQAGGNIAAALYMGATVFLDENNAFYKEYKDAGACVFSIEELEFQPSLIGYALTLDEKEKNQLVVYSMRCWDRVIEKTEKLIEFFGGDVGYR